MSHTEEKHSEERAEENNPAPDDPRKPDEISDISKRSWFYVARKTVHEFTADQCTDLAAALTYYSVQAVFPAAIALLSILGVVGQSGKAVDAVLDVIKPFISDPTTLKTISDVLNGLAGSKGAGFALIIGVVLALNAASGYVNAFSRAMNRVYEIEEGRPFWKLRPTMLLLTLVAVVLAAVALIMLVVSGPVAESLGNVIGLGSAAVTVWNIAKWPVLLVIVVFVVALLYYVTPNVQQPKFRWISIGAIVAILIWVLASVGFAFYVTNFGSYNKTYGTLAGVIVALLWLWITNIALLFGAELDAELERGRQLEAGIEAEEELQLPARDTSGIEKNEKKNEKDAAVGRKIRREAVKAQKAAAERDDESRPDDGRKEE